jgi:ABC-type transport system involved in cytochrome c biogenesis permease subunit
MAWLDDRAVYGCAVALLGVAAGHAVFLWRRGFRRDEWITQVLLALGFALNTAAMFLRGLQLGRCPVTNLFEAMMFVSWTILAAVLVLGAWPRLRFAGAFAAPLLLALGVFALQPQLDLPGPEPHFDHGLVSAHAALILLAYGAFGLGSVAALMYLSQEHDLRFHKLRAVLSRLPSIERLDRVVLGLLVAGVVLLTAGLALSPVLMWRRYGVLVSGDPKIIWSLGVWGVYVALLVLRWRHWFGGRRLAWGAVGSFGFVLLTFWGTNLLSGVHHP